LGGGKGVSQPTLVPFADARTMTAGICRQRLGPAKRPSYPHVMAYATSRPDIRGKSETATFANGWLTKMIKVRLQSQQSDPD
jgi:hypothetical protein